ncbi:MAG: glucose-1-phosphate adenylyltransferase [gamma proteobacterium symbiont of Bathyaustriella thionipta]|nr:glucose-1-phosphate adenylyltransferase [gamma proteobacterium symbiont of Bathyaustriella thionipta]MCU7951139.1 glucose-1-phosphate adenylyltransferase [gamma proteobacterium symbiont of Bathyaustriella thionipta]MCU7954888.1 glucose-1-phosphate adenylyltransferase [gamma proteobacterium symbiont of Bathyaustriella thionipta]MCU7957654.1 glucose-1-phosphate adenylyltransferase [gamma proteobacterium symbiont of Bathyaustriella thionipta]MCU7965619.1 glucose-1-phosphate adenylyltransferase 
MKERRLAIKMMAFVMAGGEGRRLRPLTEDRSKPAVPFGGRYRLVDFVLSNLVNSGVRAIYLLVQYKAQSLIEHIRKAWSISPLLQDQFVTVVPPQMKEGTSWFMGTADAVYQNLNLLKQQRPDIVAVFGADHIYRMDVRQMACFHLQKQADVSVAALPIPIEQASNFGIIQAGTDGQICGFQEKPEHPDAMPSDPERAYASMGNYLFNADVLIDALEETHQRGETDFGLHVLPRLLASHRLFAYDFSSNEVPGIKPYEEQNYWRDVGSLDAYFEAHQDMLGIAPKFDTFNPRWPIFSSNDQGPVAQIISGQLTNSMLGVATLVNNATISNSIIRHEAVVESGAVLEDCIIMDYVRIGSGSHLRRVIVDRHNIINENSQIGYNREQDQRHYHVTPSGLVIVPPGMVSYFARHSSGSEFNYLD